MICTQLQVEEPIPGKKYACVSGTCTESATGTYTEPTCAGVCKPQGDNTGLYVLGAAALLGAYLIFGRK